MSEQLPQPDPEEYTNQAEQNMEVFHLAKMFEAFAQAYSQDYAEDLDDGCIATKGSIELGGLLSSSITFEANRLRGSVFSQVPGEVGLSEYTLTSVIRQDGLHYPSLPEALKDYVDEFEDFANEDYDETTDVGVSFEQSYFVTSDGDYAYKNSLILHLDDDALVIPDTEPDMNVDDLLDDQLIEVIEEAENKEDDPLAGLFSFDEVCALKALTARVIEEHANVDALRNFYKQIDSIRFLSRPDRIHFARNILRQLFSEDVA